MNDFDQWEIADDNGVTVRDVYRQALFILRTFERSR